MFNMDIQKLSPALKDYIWGGKKLTEKYGKHSDKLSVAESWELSFLDDGLTLLENGEPLKTAAGKDELGKNLDAFGNFPLLVKLIDAKNDLSVQVHPSDSYALKYENSYGKTEMWYVVEAEEGAGLYLGFNKDVTTEEIEKAIKENTICDLMNFYKVKAGETYFIPSGTVHAICKGCLILEIQQSSNLTYRLYDYDRVDSYGNKRPLHVEKALKVIDTKKFALSKNNGDLLGLSKYFTVRKFTVADSVFKTDGRSFKAVTCVSGEGLIEEKTIKTGDTFFVPANYGEFRIKGQAEVVITEVRKYYVGIDIGGTFVKIGVADDIGNLVACKEIATQSEKGVNVVVGNISDTIKELLDELHLPSGDIEGIGVGIPGLINNEKGEILYSNNIKWENVDFAKLLEAACGIKVKTINDADAAALGETLFGAGKGCDSCVMVTLGTGVGSGVVIGGRIYGGNYSVGSEIGHTVIVFNGEKCTCGRKGCFEAHASATALIRETKRAMQSNKDSKMREVGLDNINGKTAFDYYKTDDTARTVVDRYIEYLSCGIVNISNAFRSQIIIIGGGVGKEKLLLDRLQEAVDKYSFGGERSPKCKVVAAKFENNAGLLGAAALWMD